MLDLCDIQTIQSILSRHGFHFSKSLGQNFLIDASIPKSIAISSNACESSAVLEIGPGIGCLTQQLAQRAGKVISVELDERLIPVLEETMSDYPNFSLISGDIMDLDLSSLVDERMAGYQPMVCANLPYNITTPVLTKLVESQLFSEITVLIQKEVAERICAQPGSPDYGAFTLLMQYYSEPEIISDVPPTSFLPQPKVTSSVLHCRVRKTPPVSTDPKHLFHTVRAGFAQRRKTLVNSLQTGFSQYSKQDLQDILLACGFPSDIRGERLSLEDYARLSERLFSPSHDA